MAPPPVPSTKVCVRCGRHFAWRKKWARSWDAVLTCSDACRRGRDATAEVELEQRILALLARRARGLTICPSEVLPEAEKQDPERMEAVRAAARRLCHRGELDVLQRGARVDPDRARGPIRLRRRDPSPS